MPVRNIQALIDSYHERQRTGVIRLGYAGEKHLCFLFKRGEILNTYLVTPEKCESLQPDQGVNWMLSAGDSYTMPVSLSTFGLLMSKMLFQSQHEATETFVHHDRLSEYLENIREKSQTTLLHLAWKNAASAALFDKQIESHVTFVSKDLVLDEEGSYKVLSEWRETQCGVTRYMPNISTPAWQEYLLRSAFANLCRSQINHLEMLTGRALVDSLVRLVAVFAARQNLDISVTARKLVDKEVFSSPQEAAQKYGLLLGEMFEHFSAVIGPRLHAAALRDMLKSLPEPEHQIIKMYSILPQGYSYE